jgi:integrase
MSDLMRSETCRFVSRSVQAQDFRSSFGHKECRIRFCASDRALIGVMVYTFARINAVLEMKVSDYFVQGRRGWVRLHEKGGKEHEVPCHHNLEKYLDEYIAAAGFADDPDGAALPARRPARPAS